MSNALETGKPRQLHQDILSRQTQNSHIGLLARKCSPTRCWIIKGTPPAAKGHGFACHRSPDNDPDPGPRAYIRCCHLSLPESAFL